MAECKDPKPAATVPPAWKPGLKEHAKDYKFQPFNSCDEAAECGDKEEKCTLFFQLAASGAFSAGCKCIKRKVTEHPFEEFKRIHKDQDLVVPNGDFKTKCETNIRIGEPKPGHAEVYVWCSKPECAGTEKCGVLWWSEPPAEGKKGHTLHVKCACGGLGV